MSFLDETGYRHLYQKIVNKVTALWQKVGTATLTTTAQNTSEAVNELKSSLDDNGTWVELLVTNNSITTTLTSYDLNDDFTKYKSIVIQMCRYDNVYQSIVVSSTYFNNTHNGGRPLLGMWNENIYAIQVYKNTTTKVYIKASSNLGSDMLVKIYGIK